MSQYRPIYKKIWKDPSFSKLPLDAKLVFIYLCTNDLTTESGIYPISLHTIAFETGAEVSRVGEIMHTLPNIFYDPDNEVVFVKNFHRYNAKGRPELVRISVLLDYKACPHTPLWLLFLDAYPSFRKLSKEELKRVPEFAQVIEVFENEDISQYLINIWPTVDQHLANTLESVSQVFNSNRNSNSNSTSNSNRNSNSTRDRSRSTKDASTGNSTGSTTPGTSTEKETAKKEEAGLVKATKSLTPQEFLELYHSLCPNLRKVRTLTNGRKDKIKTRLKEHPEPEYWEAVFRKANSTPFLTGENDRGWKAGLDFIIRNDTIPERILEGYYDFGKKGKMERWLEKKVEESKEVPAHWEEI